MAPRVPERMQPADGAGGSAPRVLDRRALNRATLARQMLLERADLTPLGLVERLIGLQAQTPHSWYVGLWSRLSDLRPLEVSDLLVSRALVRIGLMRGTIHLVTAEDCLGLRPVMQPALDRILRGSWARVTRGVDLPALTRVGRELFEESPRTLREIRALLAERLPGTHPDLAQTLGALLPLVQVPPRGLWGRSGPTAFTTAEAWLGRPLGPPVPTEDLVRRYLGAFGPATYMDMQAWCGLTGLRVAFEGLRPQLLTFRDERGKELFDLPDAPRPDPETPAPVRFLYDYDNLLLSHADRSRFVTEEDRRRATERIGAYSFGSVLVDGFATALWRVERGGGTATLQVETVKPLAAADSDAVEEEGAKLLAFLAPDGAGAVEIRELRTPA